MNHEDMKVNRHRWPMAVVSALLLFSPTLTVAVPIDWQVPWNVQLDQNQIMGVGAKQRAFGVSATLDGQTVDLEADIAVARAEAAVFATNSLAVGRVDFERSFRLAGSPQGWLVELQGVLSGDLFIVTDPGMNAEADVRGKADIFDNNGNFVGPSITAMGARQAVGMTSFVLDLFRDTALLDDGIYTIKGFLEAGAASNLVNRDPPPVIAQSRFFNGGWEVSISATPVHEPSTLLLIGFGVLVMVAKGRNFRARGHIIPDVRKNASS